MSDQMKFFYLKNHPMLSLLDGVKMEQAAAVARIKTVSRGESISYGEAGYTRIHFLVKGKVKITDRAGNENELIKDILTEPDIFGDLGLDGMLTNEEQAAALTPNTIICSFYVNDFKRILENNPSMVLGYARKVNSKLQRLENRHSDLVHLDAKDRLIRFIRNWARSDGNRIGDKIVLSNYLTHSDIAGFICTSRQSVNMLLNELRTAGMLHYNRKQIELSNSLAWN